MLRQGGLMGVGAWVGMRDRWATWAHSGLPEAEALLVASSPMPAWHHCLRLIMSSSASCLLASCSRRQAVHG